MLFMSISLAFVKKCRCHNIVAVAFIGDEAGDDSTYIAMTTALFGGHLGGFDVLAYYEDGLVTMKRAIVTFEFDIGCSLCRIFFVEFPSRRFRVSDVFAKKCSVVFVSCNIRRRHRRALRNAVKEKKNPCFPSYAGTSHVAPLVASSMQRSVT